MIKTYSELQRFDSFMGRYRYLKLRGRIGESTFGYDRYLNQILYSSYKWKEVRNHVILRDNGCDLGVKDYEIFDMVIIHHMNPITAEDIENESPLVFDPEYLICVSELTHKAIHYGNESLLPSPVIIRQKNDTIPWKR